MILEQQDAQMVSEGAKAQVGEERDLFEVAVEQFQIAADVLGLDDGMRKILSHCQRELTVHFPVEMDDGSVDVFTGYRVQHNSGPGPTKGGIRYHESVTLPEAKALAMWMTWKRAVVGWRCGGAQGCGVSRGEMPVNLEGMEGAGCGVAFRGGEGWCSGQPEASFASRVAKPDEA